MLKLSFLWHQHQPFYKDLSAGYYHMPWVRLHGAKDYLDMALVLKDYPAVRQTFNMVPSLLEQLGDYASGTATDPHLELSRKKASELSDQDKTRILDLFFQANYDRMIRPYRRFRRLYENRARAAAEWGEKEWRDLQTLSNLVWIDPMFRRSGRMAELTAKGEGYSEEEKEEILQEQQRIIARIVPEMKAMMEQGQIEISTSTYYHPILPLLCDSHSARKAMPHIELPENHFSHPEDAEKQVAMAVELYTDLFGRAPSGMWPSEGAVSEEIIPIIERHGIRWIATDEEILAHSLVKEANLKVLQPPGLVRSGQLYRGYSFDKNGASLSLFFRDHTLSDSIGFVYSQWDPEKAAADFLAKLKAINGYITAGGIADPIVSVILDGENAWEYYPNDGHDFLKALYEGISDANWLETTTFSHYLAGKPELERLERLYPGSWINHSFGIWIGHPEDNKAWDLLGEARDYLGEFQGSNPGFDKGKLRDAWREIYIAEGSDWCWWFGDDHIGPNNDEFDRLYRSHLANVYKLTEREPPPELLKPVRTRFRPVYLTMPVDYITPTIDGKLTHYYEWQQAGFFDCQRAGSTMHRGETVISGIWFGFDQRNLYLRIDGSTGVDGRRFRELTFEVEIMKPGKGSLTVSAGDASMRYDDVEYSNVECKIDSILELAMPLDNFGTGGDKVISFRVLIKDSGKIIETWPATEALQVEFPKPGSALIPWVI